MDMSDLDREERRRLQAEVADSLKESGALDEIFARIDAGEPLTGHEGLLKGMLKASLERGLETELSDHGTQYTSWAFTQRAVDSGLLPSM